MKAFKAFDKNWCCRDQQYAVGGEYTMEGSPVICRRGFHACEKLVDCFDHYPFDPSTKVAEVELFGEIVGSADGKKVAANGIKIVKELTWDHVLAMVNTGDRNTGNRNTGNRNTGDRNTGDGNTGDRNTGYRNTGHRNTGYRNTGDGNTGDRNTGYRNTGYRNTGDRNTGDGNTGDRNTGNRNTGYRNTGYRNTGDRNTGDGNTGNYNKTDFETGFFNTRKPKKIRVFNCEINMSREDFLTHPAVRLLGYIPAYDDDGNDLPLKKAWKIWWGGLTDDQKDLIPTIPGFDAKVWRRITGIDLASRQSSERA